MFSLQEFPAAEKTGMADEKPRPSAVPESLGRHVRGKKRRKVLVRKDLRFPSSISHAIGPQRPATRCPTDPLPSASIHRRQRAARKVRGETHDRVGIVETRGQDR